jgi:hypothetical protein
MNQTIPISTSETSGHRERLRQRFLAGDSSFSDEEKLELLLTFAIPRRDVVPIVRALLKAFGDASGIFAADVSALRTISGVGDAAVCLLKLVGAIKGEGGERPVREEAKTPVVSAPSSRPARQNELFAALEDGSPLGAVRAADPVSSRRTIQDVLIPEGFLAVRLSRDESSVADLQEKLGAQLSQNSGETRRRYALSVVRWFFADGLDGLLRKVWIAYEDEAMTTDLLRYLYLAHEPVMGRCVAEAIFPLEPGISIPGSYFDQFLAGFFQGEAPSKTRERVKQNLKKLGFLDRSRGKPDSLAVVNPQKTSFILLVHHLFAANSVRTIELRNLLANPFWKYLGYKSEDAVRSALREADAAGLLGKYVVADQLEQVTTCFTFNELLERKVRL